MLNYSFAFVNGILREIQHKPRKVYIAKWFSMATFDLVGDLAFSKSFGCLATSVLHPWITVIFGAFKALPLPRVLREMLGVTSMGK